MDKNNINIKKKQRGMDPETLILRKYKGPVIKKLKQLAEQRQLARVCREVFNGRINPVRLTEIHTGARELTPYYFSKLLRGGIVSIENILQGRKLSDLPEDDQVVIRKISMDDELVRLIGRAQEKGINIKTYLQQLLGDR